VAKKWVSTAAGKHLSGRVRESTAPEVALRKALHAAGARFRLHRHLAKGCTPDIVLPSRHLAIFVDGCFWHGCPMHGRKTPWTGPNAELWADKMQRNRGRDERSTQVAQELGWIVVRAWECEVRKSASAVAGQVLRKS
jgi:DNA mismatch endonuclease (patch repair protein)